MAKYRPNVAALVLNREGKLLVCERVNSTGLWQFPQGGVDAGEKRKHALAREVEEEIGLPSDAYRVLEKRGGYTYLYPKQVRKQKSYFDGQVQTYYLCRLKKNAPELDLKRHKNQEFGRYQWINPDEFNLKWLPEFKRQVYRAVMLDFFGVRL
ncbi:RNA pyrophosphohydrolase [Verrucomicrobiaceae bacterium R5-34]|uniref:RNA pyrophosphohydrolase n=1 Tax=Oceaniferula flava TaxID=2800421 RepID=A0AAE2SG32_9BACT|nr:RNA pyrophosphohydrolase [Oceaniferula flavus]MBK1829853.1 RNA pyrophosphohydrolase [Verrucomicrobiaceae bacterium R5-34]MBK1856322.1 RNA pyrophosphohydrolase [Oceaniferula flavus]MBM1137629.1 RNA pyrophosphohydrolase [Oceaniferula flavus]